MANREKENISEYIIRMYRSEDLVRAFELDLEKIGAHVINHLPLSNIEKLSEVNFYDELIGKMRRQKIESSGHLEELNVLVQKLEKLSLSLLETDEQYQKIYDQAHPNIQKNIDAAEGKITNEIQICLNGIYGFLLLKLSGKSVDSSTKTMLEQFGDLLSYLSAKYRNAAESN